MALQPLKQHLLVADAVIKELLIERGDLRLGGIKQAARLQFFPPSPDERTTGEQRELAWRDQRLAHGMTTSGLSERSIGKLDRFQNDSAVHESIRINGPSTELCVVRRLIVL